MPLLSQCAFATYCRSVICCQYHQHWRRSQRHGRCSNNFGRWFPAAIRNRIRDVLLNHCRFYELQPLRDSAKVAYTEPFCLCCGGVCLPCELAFRFCGSAAATCELEQRLFHDPCCYPGHHDFSLPVLLGKPLRKRKMSAWTENENRC